MENPLNKIDVSSIEQIDPMLKKDEMVAGLPIRPVASDKLDYFADYTSDYIPGSQMRNILRLNGSGSNVESRNDVFTVGPLGPSTTIDGSKSFFEARVYAQYDDGTPILATDDVKLAPECSNILFQWIQLHVNDKVVVSSQRQDVARHVMRRLTTSNGDRVGNCYRHEFMGDDSELATNAGNSLPDLLYKIPIQDKKKFYLTRPIDELPMHGQLDSDIPPNTRLQFTIKYCPDSTWLFRTDSTAGKPTMFFDYVDFNYYTNKLTTKATEDLQEKMRNNNGTFLYVSDLWRADQIPNGIINQGQTTYNPTMGSILQSTFDVAYIVLFPQSTFSPTTDGSKGKSVYNKTWANVDVFQLNSNGANLRNYINLTASPTTKAALYRGIVNGLSSKWDASPYRAVSPFNFMQFMEGGMAMFPIDLRYVNSEDVQHPEISNLTVLINFGIGGCPEPVVPYLITKSKMVLNYLPDGTVQQLR